MLREKYAKLLFQYLWTSTSVLSWTWGHTSTSKMAIGQLTELYYEDLRGLVKGHAWIVRNNYLMPVWKDSSLVQTKTSLQTILIPLKKKKKKNVYAGVVNLKLGLVENVYGAIFEITSPIDYCLLALKMAVTKKKDFVITLPEDDHRIYKIPLFEKSEKNCQPGIEPLTSAEAQFKSWEKFMDGNRLINNLFQMKPENEPVKHNEVKNSFITHMSLYPSAGGQMKACSPCPACIWALKVNCLFTFF